MSQRIQVLELQSISNFTHFKNTKSIAFFLHMKIRGLSKKFLDNRVFVILNGFIYGTCIHIVPVHLNLCHKISNQTKVVLNVFHRNKLKFKCFKGLRKVRTAQHKNCPNFVIEFLDMNIYIFLKTFQNLISFYYNVACMVYVIFIQRLKLFSN